MPRWAGTTAARGLGAEHQSLRRLLLARLAANPGQPCPYCGRPMLPGQLLDLDHAVPRALGGFGPRRLTHMTCNRSRGATFGNRLRAKRRRMVSRAW